MAPHPRRTGLLCAGRRRVAGPDRRVHQWAGRAKGVETRQRLGTVSEVEDLSPWCHPVASDECEELPCVTTLDDVASMPDYQSKSYVPIQHMGVVTTNLPGSTATICCRRPPDDEWLP